MSDRSYRSMRALQQRLTGPALVLAMTACGADGEQAQHRSIERRAAPDSHFQAASLEDTLDTFADELGRHEHRELNFRAVLPSKDAEWEAVGLGMSQALGELEVAGEVVSAQAEEQAELVREQLEQGISGIGIALAPAATGQSVEEALDSTVPTVTLNSDFASSKRELFIGLTEYETGQAIGDTLLDVMPLREGTVILLGTEDEQRQGDYQRTLGAKDVIEETGLSVITRSSNDSADGERTDVETLVQDLLEMKPLPLAMVGVFESSYRIGLAAQAAERLVAEGQEGAPKPDASDEEVALPGLTHFGGVTLVTFGMAPQTTELMQARVIHATLAERRYYLGYLLPYVLYGLNVLGAERTRYILTPHLVDEHRVHLGLDSVLAEELEDYVQFTRELRDH